MRSNSDFMKPLRSYRISSVDMALDSGRAPMYIH